MTSSGNLQFAVNLHTPGHVDCPVCARYRERLIEPAKFGRLKFRDAHPKWLAEHKPGIAIETHKLYLSYFRFLDRFFGDLVLEDIGAWHVQAYQDERKLKVGHSLLNHEINALKHVLDRAGLWTPIGRFYRPVKKTKPKAGRALDGDEETRLFRVAATSPRWRVGYWGALITASTTAHEKEITHLHFDEVDLTPRPAAPFGIMWICASKNEFRRRGIPLNETSQYALGKILDRYFDLCRRLAKIPHADDFILPGRKRAGRYDFAKPMGSWRKAWEKLRAAAGLSDLRFYDLRHHAITKLTESGDVSDHTTESVAGHAPGSPTKKIYSHPRMAAKFAAVSKLEILRPGAAAAG